MENPNLPPRLREIQALADALGYEEVPGLLMAAGMWPSYWSRWIKDGINPSLATMGRIKAVQTGPAAPQGAA